MSFDRSSGANSAYNSCITHGFCDSCVDFLYIYYVANKKEAEVLNINDCLHMYNSITEFLYKLLYNLKYYLTR